MAVDYHIRTMTARDIPVGMRLKGLAGWNQVEEDWQLLLELSPQGCFVAVCDGRVVGTVTTVSYENRVSWIGMLLVDPAHRRQGIGTGLLQRALAGLRGSETVKLDATPAGEALYVRQGFQREWPLVRMAIDCLPPVPGPPPDACPVMPETLEPIVALDRAVFGADRGLLLRALTARAPDLAWLRVRQGQAVGMCLGRRGSRFAQLGPLVAESAGDAELLCRAALRSLAGKAVALDVPERQGAFLSWLQDLGFAVQRPFVRMTCEGGPKLTRPDSGVSCPDIPGRPLTDDRRPSGTPCSGAPSPGAPGSLFASAGPEFG